MNLKFKNGEDILTLDAAERRCLEKAQAVCRKLAQIGGRVARSAGEEAAIQLAFVLEATTLIKPRAKAEAGK